MTFPGRLVLRAGRPLLLVVIGCGLVFCLMPRSRGMRLRALPVSWRIQFHLPSISHGQVVNPSYPSSRATGGAHPFFSPDNYFGFNPVVDLDTRGRLSNAVVMKVRTSGWTYYRGLAFDHYDGRRWTLSNQALKKLQNSHPPIYLPWGSGGRHDDVQIFYIQKSLPNVVFAGLRAGRIYFPSQELYLDSAGCLRAPIALERGMVYSAISYPPKASPARLRRLSQRDPNLKRLADDLQLPASLPNQVRRLARRLVRDRRGAWLKASALTEYLQNHYTYNRDVPAYPPEADTADYFLFHARQGSCEQFATALAVMCRAVGVHARFVTGYLPGTYNPFTGFYEVRGSDAHAWVEVYIPNLGWTTFDAVPGADATPTLSPPPEHGLFLMSLLRYLGVDVHWPGWLRIPWKSAAVVGVLGLLAGLLGKFWRPWTGRRRAPGVAGTFYLALALLERRGLVRGAAETPRQFSRRVAIPELEEMALLFERERYAGEPSFPEDRARARRLLKALRRPSQGPDASG